MKKQIPINDFEDYVAIQMQAIPTGNSVGMGAGSVELESADRLALHMTDCLWVNVFKALNATDVDYIMCCHPDFATAQAAHPNIKLKRTKTLMQGDDCCDRRWCWEE
jgi:hypothetical protein